MPGLTSSIPPNARLRKFAPSCFPGVRAHRVKPRPVWKNLSRYDNSCRATQRQGFSWASVAASAIAAPVANSINNSLLGKVGSDGLRGVGALGIVNQTAKILAESTTSALVSATTRVAIVGGKLDWVAVSADALSSFVSSRISRDGAIQQAKEIAAREQSAAQVGVIDSGGMQDLVYRPQDGDNANITLASANSTTRKSLFSAANNAAFSDKISGIDDPIKIAQLQLDRLRQADVISYSQYVDVLSDSDQSREAYGRAVWNAVNTRVGDETASADPITRNSNINSAYFSRFSENPDAYWMGLATVASDMVGQGLSLAKSVLSSSNTLPLQDRLIMESTGVLADARTGYAGLAEGNLRVASDMLPMYDVFNDLGGYKGLSAIADVRVDALTGKTSPIPSSALEGYRLLDEGRQITRGLMQGDASAKFTESLKVLALHEQRDVLQPIYDSKFAGQTLRSVVKRQLEMSPFMPNFLNPLTPNVLGTYVNPNDALSSTSFFKRDLGDLNQRMTFVGKVADTFANNLNQIGTRQTLDFLGKLRLAPGTVTPPPSMFSGKSWNL